MRISSTCFQAVLLGLSLFSLSLLSRPACAQTTVLPLPGHPTQTTAKFTMPQNTDPLRLTFTNDGNLYTHADAVNPGDDAGQLINGQLLATNGSAPGGGLELHGLLGSGLVFSDVKDIDLFTTYTGGLRIDSIVSPVFSTTFSPWNVVRIAPISNYAQGFRFINISPTQAPLNLGQFFAELQAGLADPTDPTGFYTSTFGIAGFSTIQTTPEPGSMALLSGLTVCGGMLWRRRRQRSGRCI
jgi:hypothetical protein